MQPLLGLVIFIAVAWGLSENRRAFPWRTVLTGLGLQFLLAWLILCTRPGRAVFDQMDEAFRRLLSFADEGTAMVFGPLAKGALLGQTWGPENAFLFAVTITGTIIFVSALSAALYHYGILQRVVTAAAWIMRRAMRTSGTESLAAAANIFMGQTEAPLVVQPYLPYMSRSELMALMVGGMATIAGGVLAAYISLGIPAGHLITASVISAPAALIMAKVMLPPATNAVDEPVQLSKKTTANGIDALCQGASEGVKLALNVMAMLIAFVATVALVNHLAATALGWIGIEETQPLQRLLGWVQAPFAWLMGIPWQDCQAAGAILGERVVLNEFVGYLSLSQQQDSIHPRSYLILTYALCGFANFASIAIQIGGIGSLAPERRQELAQLGFRAMVGGLLACYSTACIAGLLLK